MRLDAEFMDTAVEVAGALGFVVKSDPEERLVGVHLVDNEGRRLFMRRDYRDKSKLSISGDYPGDHYDLAAALRRLNHGRVSEIEAPYIRVTFDRGPEKIAKEIQRRLLNSFVTIHDAVLQVKLDTDSDTVNRHAAAHRLCSLLPGTSLNLQREDSRATNTEIRWYNSTNDVADGYGDIVLNHDGSSASLTLKSVPFAVAERVLKALAGG